MYRIELRPHKGKTIQGVEVEHDQWMIYANGRHCGYVGKQEGAHVSLFEVTKSEEIGIRQAVQQQLGERQFAVCPTDEEVVKHEKAKRGKR